MDFFWNFCQITGPNFSAIHLKSFAGFMVRCLVDVFHNVYIFHQKFRMLLNYFTDPWRKRFERFREFNSPKAISHNGYQAKWKIELSCLIFSVDFGFSGQELKIQRIDYITFNVLTLGWGLLQGSNGSTAIEPLSIARLWVVGLSGVLLVLDIWGCNNCH